MRSFGLTSERSFNALFFILAVCAGSSELVSSSPRINPDGVSYIEVARSYMEGRWSDALVEYWSPLYPILIATVLWLFEVDLWRELVAVRLLNGFLFLLSCGSFAWFLSELNTMFLPVRHGFSTAQRLLLPGICWPAFLTMVPVMITISLVTPDLLVAVLVFSVSALSLRVQFLPNMRRVVLLGLLLGLAVLAKAALIPFVLLTAGTVLFNMSNRRLALGAVLLASCASITLPYLLSLSNTRGRFVYNNVGTLAYAWFVNGTSPSHWQGGAPRTTVPDHPTRQIHSNPAIYEFDTPYVHATYAPWYNASYWNSGLRPYFDVRQQLTALARTGRSYLVMGQDTWFLWGFLLLVWIATGLSLPSPDVTRSLATVFVPSAGLVILYSLVYVEGRYVAPLFVVVFTAFAAFLISVLRSPRHKVFAIIASLILWTASLSVLAIGRIAFQESSSRRDRDSALGVKELGITKGTSIASVGYSFDCYWAHLAGARIVAEVAADESSPFWASNGETRRRVLATLKSTGAEFLVTEDATARRERWVPINGGALFVYPLRRTDAVQKRFE